MKTAAERKRDERSRMRSAGFVLRQLWVHPTDWPAVKAYVEAKRRKRTAADKPPAALTCEHGNMVGGCVACAFQPTARAE